MASTRSPLRNRALHDSVGLGDITFPPSPREGVAIVEIDTSQKIDEQKANGTDKAKTKRNGKEPASVKITLRWTFRIYDEVQEMLAYLDPNGPQNGGPFTIVHPKAEARRVKDIIVKKMSDVKNITPGLYEVALDATEWNPAPKTQGRAATTPQKAQPWQEPIAAAIGQNFARSGLPAEVAAGLEGYDALVAKGLAPGSPIGPDDKP